MPQHTLLVIFITHAQLDKTFYVNSEAWLTARVAQKFNVDITDFKIGNQQHLSDTNFLFVRYNE